MRITKFVDASRPLDPARWRYLLADGTPVRDPERLEWIAALRIPPAWRDVNIWTTGRQTACGRDPAGRTQCLYSEAHRTSARAKKYRDLVQFGEKLPTIQADVARALAGTRLSETRVIALVVRIVMCCAFRLGTLAYEAQNESYGITTIRREHVWFEREAAAGGAARTVAHIEFSGKKAVENRCTVRDREAVETLHELLEAQRSQTVDTHVMRYQSAGEWHHVRHTDVNRWLKRYGENITSKDFRTWEANVRFIDAIRVRTAAACGASSASGATATRDPTTMSEPERKRVALAAIREVAEHVHNTPAVCRADYIDPDIIATFVAHPRRYRACFITPATPARNMLLAWLRAK